MIHAQYPIYHHAKLVLECATPLSIKADDADPTFDTRLMRDANGLPTIPGTAIAGVLRSLCFKAFGEETANQIFGYAQGSASQKSLLSVSFGYIHNSKNQPIQGLVSDESIAKDELLLKLKDAQPIVRDQVKLTHKGVAKKGGKMDRTLVPSGTRFSVELTYLAQDKESSQWQNILSLFTRPDFRLGGLTRRGLGTMKVESAQDVILDLQEPKDRQAWLAKPAYQQCADLKMNTQHPDFIALNLALQAEDFWRIGSGHSPIGENYSKDPKMMPKTEWRVSWLGNQAQLFKHKKSIVIPATAIKGALSHRLAFHYNCEAGQYVEQQTAQVEGDNLAVRTVFGIEKNTQKDTGHAGFVLFNDVYLDQTNVKTQVIMHNAIDRFTGGTVDGALYSEELLWQTPLTLDIYFDKQGLTNYIHTQNLSQQERLNIQTALRKTFEDLTQSRLAIGAGSTKGHGYFSAKANPIEFDNLLTGAVT